MKLAGKVVEVASASENCGLRYVTIRVDGAMPGWSRLKLVSDILQVDQEVRVWVEPEGAATSGQAYYEEPRAASGKAKAS